MQPLIIAQSRIVPFVVPLIHPFTFAGNTLIERVGYYLELTASDGSLGKGEIAPLPGMSTETLRKAKHDLEEILLSLSGREILTDKDDLIKSIRDDHHLSLSVPSVRFGVESALFSLSAHRAGKSLGQFLEASDRPVDSAVLLQGSHDQIITEAKTMREEGRKVFKLKVGDRNIPMDVKKVQDLRAVIGHEGTIRLDGNRVWSMNEAVLFVQLAGRNGIEFIEEPLSDMSRLSEFYNTTHMPVALDETLSLARCGVTAPGRCSPTLSTSEGVKAYVIKPSILGGVVVALDWIDEARHLGKKAIISSAFETNVGMGTLKALALLTDEPAGLGTERWLKPHAE